MTFNVKQQLAATWKYFPAEPLTVGGIPISCPGCGAADGLRFWLYPGDEQVSAQHTCVSYDFRRGVGRVRRWLEPHVGPDQIREAGRDMLAVTSEIARELNDKLNSR